MSEPRRPRRPHSVVQALIICRRELAGYIHAPIAYVVGVLFLVMQGLSFSAVVSALSDPARPAPLGAVLRTHFGGTLLYWAVLMVIVAAIAMRLVAEERRQGTWEALLTAPVSEAAAIAGKWLGAALFYALLWLPTGLYLVVLSAYAPPEASFDPGPVAAAYLGAIASGAAFLAIGLAASASTSNQIIAAVATFAALMLLLVAGQVAALEPAWLADHPSVRALLGHIDVHGHMDAFARGEIATPALAFYAGLAAVALAAAITAATADRRRPAEVRARVVATLLVACIAVLANALIARHPHRWDVTRAGTNSLDPRTRQILAEVGETPIDVLVIRAGLPLFADVQAEVDRLLDRMIRAQPQLRRRVLDPALQPERVDELAREFAIAVDNLADGGAVVFQRGSRRRAVDLLDMAGFARDDLGAGKLAQFRAEAAFAAAIRELVDPDRPRICTTVGHEELPLSAVVGRPHWGALGDRVRRDGGEVVEVGAAELAAGVPAGCRALIVAGPRRPLAPSAARAVAAYLAAGGRLLLALPDRPIDGAGVGGGVGDGDSGGRVGDGDSGGRGVRFPDTGLALVVAEYGVVAPAAIALDPAGATDSPERWLTVDGYGDHPITAAFQDRRTTLWLSPRPVLWRPDDAQARADVRGDELVRTSLTGWGETDLTSLATGRAAAGPDDLLGPVPIAVAAQVPATGARLVVFGGATSLSSVVTDRGAGAGDVLAASALAWLTGQSRPVDIDAKTPEQVRLIMTGGQRRWVFALCVVLIPGGFCALGGLVWWRRRRS